MSLRRIILGSWAEEGMPNFRSQLAIMLCLVVVVASVVITGSVFGSLSIAGPSSARWFPASTTTWFESPANGSAALSLTTATEPGDPADTQAASAGIATLYESAVVQNRPATPDPPYSPFAAERVLVADRDGITIAGGVLAGRRTRFLPRPLLVPSRPTVGQAWSVESTLDIVRLDGKTASIALTTSGRVDRIDTDRCVTISRTVTIGGDEPDRITETWCPGRGRVFWQERGVDGVLRAVSPTDRPVLAAPVIEQPAGVLHDDATWIRQPIDGPGRADKLLSADPSAPPIAVPGAIVDFGSRVAAATALDLGGAGVRWQVPTGAPPTGRAVTDGVLVVATAIGEVAGLDAGTGFVRWRRHIGAVVGVVVIPSGVTVLGLWDGTIVGLEAATGHRRWSTRLSGPVRAIVAVDRRIAVIDSPGRLTVLDEFGAEVAAVDIGHLPSGDLAVIEQQIVVGTDDGQVVIVSQDGAIVADIAVAPIGGARVMVSGVRALIWEKSRAKGEISAVVIDLQGSVQPVPGAAVVAAAPSRSGWLTVTDDARCAVVTPEGKVRWLTDRGGCHPATLPLTVGSDLWYSAPFGVFAVAGGAR